MKTKRDLPSLTSLQFLVMQIIGAATITGRQLREALKQQGYHKTGPGFYQMMARLEDSRFIEAKETPLEVNGVTYREKKYKVTGIGQKALAEYQNFHVEAQRLSGVFNYSNEKPIQA